MAPTHKVVLALAAAGLAAPLAAAQQTQVLYSQDFETGTSFPGWSTNVVTQAPTFTRFLGRFSDERATLTLALPELPQDDVPGGGGGGGGGGGEGGGGGTSWTYLLSFRFHCIDSWDGADTQWGPDRFRVLIDTATMLDETFGPYNPAQGWRPPTIGHAHLGFNDEFVDAIFDISIPFVVPAGVHQFHFESNILQPLNDESWGIDNVNVSMVQIPAPGAAAAAGALGALAMRRRRR